jgi:predicted enzyme related to lactoylglutathione lyase
MHVPGPGRRFTTLCAWLGSTLLIAHASAAPLDLPPIVASASAERHAGKVVWRELVTPDLRGAEDFYGAMFGWTFRDAAAGAPAAGPAASAAYVIALLGGEPVAGLVRRRAPSGGPVQPAWLNFFAVGDVDAIRHSAEQHGAKVLAEPRSYGRRGRQAILADPQGAVFAILASGGGDGPDELAPPGEWIWTSLLVRNADQDAAFYQDLLGYEVFDLPSPDGREHVVLASDNLARASVNDMPDDSANRHPHWLGFVRVLDVAAMASRARELGGRVLVEPHTDRHGGQVAVIADPQGAPFGLMDWNDANMQGSAR